MDQSYILVVTTVPDTTVKTEQGEKKAGDVIIEGLLSQQLAACVNTLGPVTSKYWWKEQIETASEYMLLIKTKTALFPDVQQFIKEKHPYSVPEVIAFNIADGSQDYLTWIGASCRYCPRVSKEDQNTRK